MEKTGDLQSSNDKFECQYQLEIVKEGFALGHVFGLHHRLRLLLLKVTKSS